MRTPHLRREERRGEILKLLRRMPRATVLEISNRIGMSRNATSELMRELHSAGKVKADSVDHTNHWSLA